MKNLLIISALFIAGEACCAQKLDPKDVPAPVMAKFSAFYGEIKKPKWEKEGSNYEAVFKSADKKKMSIVFTPEGNIYEKITVVKPGEMPKAVQDSIKKFFPGAKIEETEKIDRNGLMIYQFEFDQVNKDKKKEEVQVEITPEGKIWSKTIHDDSVEKKNEEKKKDEKKPEPKKEEKKEEPKK